MSRSPKKLNCAVRVLALWASAVCISLMVLALIFWGVKQQRDRFLAADDVLVALTYYLESHDGTLPSSESDFLACEFIDGLGDGAFRIKARPQSRYSRPSHQMVISGLAEFRIPWGMALWQCYVDSDGVARSADGMEIVVVHVGGSSAWDRRASARLVQIALECRGNDAD